MFKILYKKEDYEDYSTRNLQFVSMWLKVKGNAKKWHKFIQKWDKCQSHKKVVNSDSLEIPPNLDSEDVFQFSVSVHCQVNYHLFFSVFFFTAV